MYPHDLSFDKADLVIIWNESWERSVYGMPIRIYQFRLKCNNNPNLITLGLLPGHHREYIRAFVAETRMPPPSGEHDTLVSTPGLITLSLIQILIIKLAIYPVICHNLKHIILSLRKTDLGDKDASLLWL